MKTRIPNILFLGLVLLLSCRKPEQRTEEQQCDSPQLPEDSYNYKDKHGVNNEMATLGRVLFFDRQLSVNNAVSCGSCHKQEFAFADNVRFNK